MDTVWAMFLVTVVLRCFSWCDLSCTKTATFTVTLESFARQNRARRFLLVTEHKNEFTLSFTGRQRELGTNFTCKKECTSSNIVFSLRPAGMPDYVVAVDKRNLVLENSSTINPVDNKCKFEKRKITLHYHDNTINLNAKERYEALMFQSIPRAVMKGSRSGKVFLDKWKNWKDCQAWVKINII